MKLSKKVGLIIGAGIIVVLLCILFITYFQQVSQKQELNEQLDSTTALSSVLEAEKGDLEDELAQAESLLHTSQAQYPPEIHSIEYGEHIFEIVEKCNLTLASLTFPRPSGGFVTLTLPISGALDNIFKFIDIINTDARFASTQLNSVNLNVAGGGATISITIYYYAR